MSLLGTSFKILLVFKKKFRSKIWDPKISVNFFSSQFLGTKTLYGHSSLSSLSSFSSPSSFSFPSSFSSLSSWMLTHDVPRPIHKLFSFFSQPSDTVQWIAKTVFNSSIVFTSFTSVSTIIPTGKSDVSSTGLLDFLSMTSAN